MRIKNTNANLCNKNIDTMMIQTERQYDIYNNNMSINMTFTNDTDMEAI